MKNLKLLLIVTYFIFFPKVNFSQYGYQLAFPNMPNFALPIEMTHAYDGTNRMFVAQQRGIVYVFNNSPTVSTRKTFINITKVSQSGSETGLLGLAFHPNYENNRYFYVNFTFDTAGVIKSRISRFTASNSNPDTALVSSELILMTLTQPYSNHNGGKIAFGNDGYLYISFGDGGSGGDPLGNGQNRSTLLGKILRINVDSTANGQQYAIPTSNPFYANVNGYKEEIYAYGLRNVWKFSFDYPTDRLYAGDVGQGAYEEVDIVENGKNYGWNKMEGFHCYGTCDTTGKGFIRPIHEYTHSVGVSITGGYVYRGSLLPGLYGKYIYADYGTGRIWGLKYDGINPLTNDSIQKATFSVSTFGVDQNNELYFTSYSSSTAKIYKFYTPNIATLSLKAIIEGLYIPSLDRTSLKDTLRVYVHQTTAPYNLVDSSKTVIDSTTFTGICTFNSAATGKYYIKTIHRSGLETWSRTGGDSIVKGSVKSYDFTTDSTKAFGNNEKKVGTRYCIFSGDIVKDGTVDVSDIISAYSDVVNFESGYIVSDVNGDFTTDVSDLLIIYNNAVNFVELIRP